MSRLGSPGRAVAGVLILLVGCSAPPAPAVSPTPPPPRLPGTSISHSTMCVCSDCGARGARSVTDDEPGATDAALVGALGMTVSSSEARCVRRVYRVPGGTACETQRPPGCRDG